MLLQWERRFKKNVELFTNCDTNGNKKNLCSPLPEYCRLLSWKPTRCTISHIYL